MDLGHTNFESKEDKATGVTYSKCSSCGAVCFPNDMYFNLVCRVKVIQKENLRRRLEKKG